MRQPLLLLVLLALGPAACGDDQALIPPDRADRLLGLIDDAEQQFDDGECDRVDETLRRLREQVNRIPAEVDEELRATLKSEVRQLAQLTQECEPAEEETIPTAPPPAPPPESAPVVPTAPQTEEEPRKTEEKRDEPPKPEKEPKPPKPEKEPKPPKPEKPPEPEKAQ